jgi:hypothetical protein
VYIDLAQQCNFGFIIQKINNQRESAELAGEYISAQVASLYNISVNSGVRLQGSVFRASCIDFLLCRLSA